MSALKLYTDEDVTDLLARTLRGRGFDIVSVHETDKRGITDAEQLEIAISQERALVTFNVGDFVRLHHQYIEDGKAHFGILVSTQIPLSELISRTARLLETVQAEEMRDRLDWLNNYR